MKNLSPACVDRQQGSAGLRQFISFDKPFSAFKFVEDKFCNQVSIHRCLSLARSKGCRTMVFEKIKPMGLLKDENEELSSMGCWSSPDIYRLSFFSDKIRTAFGLLLCSNDSFLGYAIIKCDGRNKSTARWYVYESIFRKYSHRHNCVSSPATYTINVSFKTFIIKGFLYCQQNGLNKSCAHVAIQSILSRFGKEMPYSEMNSIASKLIEPTPYVPNAGLEAAQVTAILKSRELNIRVLDYEVLRKKLKNNDNSRTDFPYQKILYQGIESGRGVLLGFKLDNPKYESARHMIPFYGHTFNKDTWVTDAESEYFKISDGVGYIPSDKWTSSFIGHDDNFGPNFCIPRLYLPAEKVDYIAEVLLKDVQYTAVEAEAAAFPLLKWFIPYLSAGNVWQKRLRQAFSASLPSVVLRALCVDSEVYFNHLEQSIDWFGMHDRKDLIWGARQSGWPSKFWVIEISLPQLFSANERKLGEIVLDATKSIDTSGTIAGTSVFLFARLPSVYIIASDNRNEDNHLIWDTYKSEIESHVPVLDLSEE